MHIYFKTVVNILFSLQATKTCQDCFIEVKHAKTQPKYFLFWLKVSLLSAKRGHSWYTDDISEPKGGGHNWKTCTITFHDNYRTDSRIRHSKHTTLDSHRSRGFVLSSFSLFLFLSNNRSIKRTWERIAQVHRTHKRETLEIKS